MCLTIFTNRLLFSKLMEILIYIIRVEAFIMYIRSQSHQIKYSQKG